MESVMLPRVGAMVLGVWLAAWPAASAPAQERPADSISGRVVYNGTPPKPRTINASTDPHCEKMHEKEPLQDETVVVGKDGGLKNVFVEVVGGLPRGKKHDPPAAPVIMAVFPVRDILFSFIYQG